MPQTPSCPISGTGPRQSWTIRRSRLHHWRPPPQINNIQSMKLSSLSLALQNVLSSGCFTSGIQSRWHPPGLYRLASFERGGSASVGRASGEPLLVHAITVTPGGYLARQLSQDTEFVSQPWCFLKVGSEPEIGRLVYKQQQSPEMVLPPSLQQTQLCLESQTSISESCLC